MKNPQELFFIVVIILGLIVTGFRAWEPEKEAQSAITAEKSIILEGCEYVSVVGQYNYTHKGNCKNPIHVYATTRK